MAKVVDHSARTNHHTPMNPTQLTITAAESAAAIHDSLTADQQREALARVMEGDDGLWRVQLDLHGDDMSEEFDTEEEAIREAERAIAAGEIRGAIA